MRYVKFWALSDSTDRGEIDATFFLSNLDQEDDEGNIRCNPWFQHSRIAWGSPDGKHHF